MEKIMREYPNKRNGGRERAYRIDGKFFINSDWGSGFSGKLVPVSRREMYYCMRGDAPQSVINDILGDVSDIIAAIKEEEDEIEAEEMSSDPFDGGRGAGSMGQQID